MKIYSFIDEFSSFLPCVFTLGFFDGVHIGHKKVIQNLVLRARVIKYCSVLLTFNPHPKKVLNPEKKFFYLNTLSERIYHIKKTGIENLIIHPFTINFSKLSTKDFFQKILFSKIKIKKIITGYDSHLGKNRDGTFHQIREFSKLYGFELYKVNPCILENKIVSSTNIRKSLLKGNIEWANKALGYCYTLSGYVVRGTGIGKILDFPTANIQINKNKLIPKKGVYAVKIHYSNHIYKGMMNIGVRPTIDKKNQKIKIEVHFFDFYQNIYGKKIKVIIVQIIREEKEFNTLHDLKEQIQRDQIKIKNIFKKKSFESNYLL
ncbi:MAG: bifunctional riboflavin kinase/FAD synthetase [Flavobacteriales bacterium]|uniref:bifunctional riboflavin kinase/FAD synthetase n=1 Tax=Blattabacterium sp. (Mastotermes darwiniensis) TaxID=39768 RepID=UPI000231DF04|nr:bifunctional riboflavin kinase/FAD synthetase [Blattabacterium sp. (Mastotermes darwiniensis)]AER40824.1 riboflavin biosynthesis protein [Blattabacterium sp. (Mastotermes darwiniensis) str. MADAR]MDR1804671.1 bifunctional riboflavin kinase/FAD synthetase [Flavobacteriales bacterium]